MSPNDEKGHKNTPPNSSYDDAKLVQKLAEKVWRRRKARSSTLGVWFGLGMMGLIGWSIAVPTILGAVLVYGSISITPAITPGLWHLS